MIQTLALHVQRAPRHRRLGFVLLALALVLGQAGLTLHAADHDAGSTVEHCGLCLHAAQLGSGLVDSGAVLALPRPATELVADAPRPAPILVTALHPPPRGPPAAHR